MVYKDTISKKTFSTTLVQKNFFGHDFSGRKFFLKVFQKMTFELTLLFIFLLHQKFEKMEKKLSQTTHIFLFF